MAQMNVSFDDTLLEQLKALVPARRRSAFISEAVMDKLAILEQERAVIAAAGAWSNKGRADPEKDLRRSREGWSKRGAKSGTKR